jgi:hypothetical protein
MDGNYRFGVTRRGHFLFEFVGIDRVCVVVDINEDRIRAERKDGTDRRKVRMCGNEDIITLANAESILIRGV